MLYRPPVPRSMWGFWIIEWQDTFHIFYDEDVNANYDCLSWQKNHDHVGHIVSKDLIHWETRPSLCVRGKPGEWNEMASGGMKTGCITRYKDKFYMFVGTTLNGVQVVGVWISDDLENWKQHPDNPVLKPAGPYYLDKPVKERRTVGWRDPGIIYHEEDGYYHVCISAMLKEYDEAHYTLGSVIGHVRSKDLIHWEHLPPFHTPGLLDRFYQIEEPELFKIGEKYYMIFDGGTTGGMRTSTASRDDVRGSFYMISSKLEGPYNSPDDDLLIGSGMGSWCATTGRVIPYQNKKIFFHLSIARQPVVGTPKELCTRSDGTLYLKYMPVLENLESGMICESIEELPEFETPDSGQWHRADGKLFCDVKLAGSIYPVANNVADFHLLCKIKSSSAERAGVVVRICPDGDAGVWPVGVGIILDFAKQRIFFGEATKYHTTGWYCKAHDFCRMSLQQDRYYQLRCFIRGEHMEIYLDNRWMFTSIIPEKGKHYGSHVKHYRWGPEAPSSGAIELMAERGKAVFSDLRLAEIEPLI